MRLTLRLSPALQGSDDTRLEFNLSGLTIGECLEKVRDHSPELTGKLFKQGRLNPQLLLFHNNTIIREGDFANSVSNKDVLDIIPAIEGG